MNNSITNIFTIIGFELSTQMRTKSFWILSLLPPIAFILMFLANIKTPQIDRVGVINKTPLPITYDHQPNLEIKKLSLDTDPEDYLIKHNDISAVVYLFEDNQNKMNCWIYSNKILLPSNIEFIDNSIKEQIINMQLGKSYNRAKLFVSENLVVKHISSNHTKISLFTNGLSVVAIFITYFTILQFASSIQRSISREKKNKISEILLSAITGKEIIVGKLLSGLVLTFAQIILWIVSGISFILFLSEFSVVTIDPNFLNDVCSNFSLVPQKQIVIMFCVFVLSLVGGHLLYSLLFTLLAASSNENTNTNQYALIVTVPLLMTFVYVFRNPMLTDTIFQFLLYFPLSSPIALLPGVVKGFSIWGVIISLLVLYFAIGITLHYSSRIYEKGVMNRSSKISLKTFFSWLRNNRELN